MSGRLTAIAIGYASLMAGCVPPEAPVEDMILPGAYQVVAACVFESLPFRGYGHVVIELPGAQQTRIEHRLDGISAYSATFHAVGPSQTRLVLRAMRVVWGGYTGDARVVLDSAKSCSARMS